MNELTTQNIQLPDTLEDLTQFVLVGKAKLSAYMSRLQTVNKLSVAQSIRDQTLEETQELANALIAAEQRIGELLLSIPKQSGGVNQYNKEEKSTGVEKSKSQITEEMGYTRHEVSDYQQMAKNPEVVQKVIDDALANGTVVSKTMVMKEIKALKEELRRAKEREPEVREVIPDDFQNRLSEATQLSERRYRDMKEAQKRAEKAEAQLREVRKSENDISVKASKEAEYFEVAAYDFIKRCGGYVWLCERINDMPNDISKRFRRALFQIEAMVKTMIEQTGGYDIEQ